MIEERYLAIYFGGWPGYYLDMHRDYHLGNRYAFNVSAWLGGLLWFLYRKLYIELAVVLFCFLISDILIAFLLHFLSIRKI